MTLVTRSTAISAFDSRSDAEQAIRRLLEAGFGPDRVGLAHHEGEVSRGPFVEAEPITICVGGMFRSLIGAEIPDAEIHYYEEALQEGRSLVVVRAAERYQEAIDILHNCGGAYMTPF